MSARFTHYCPSCDVSLKRYEVDRDIDGCFVCGVCGTYADDYVACEGCDNHAAGTDAGYCATCDRAFALASLDEVTSTHQEAA